MHFEWNHPLSALSVRIWDIRPFAPAERCVKLIQGHTHNFEKVKSVKTLLLFYLMHSEKEVLTYPSFGYIYPSSPRISLMYPSYIPHISLIWHATCLKGQHMGQIHAFRWCVMSHLSVIGLMEWSQNLKVTYQRVFPIMDCNWPTMVIQWPLTSTTMTS